MIGLSVNQSIIIMAQHFGVELFLQKKKLEVTVKVEWDVIKVPRFSKEKKKKSVIFSLKVQECSQIYYN